MVHPPYLHLPNRSFLSIPRRAVRWVMPVHVAANDGRRSASPRPREHAGVAAPLNTTTPRDTYPTDGGDRGDHRL